MTSTTSRPSMSPRPHPLSPDASPREPAATPTSRAHALRWHGVRGERRALGRYIDREGRRREVVTARGSAGSTLVVDRDSSTLGDRRLVAHLASDEPPENAALVCRHYLNDAWRGRCRLLTLEDTRTASPADAADDELGDSSGSTGTLPRDRCGRVYRLALIETGMSIPELRWRRYPSPQGVGGAESVSVREAIACQESYEPTRTLTRRALARHRDDGEVSSTVLRVELARLQRSPIVLNRRLREVVVATLEREQLSMSEIAIRCGRIKCDRNGKESGETSWLARRVGILPEGGRDEPTPWIHSDVLALIARRGLGISPREVELE